MDIPTFRTSKLIVSASLPFRLSTDFFVLIFFPWAIRVQVADAIDFDARLVQAWPLSLTTALQLKRELTVWKPRCVIQRVITSKICHRSTHPICRFATLFILVYGGTVQFRTVVFSITFPGSLLTHPFMRNHMRKFSSFAIGDNKSNISSFNKTYQRTMGQNQVILRHPIIQFPTSLGVNEVSERANE